VIEKRAKSLMKQLAQAMEDDKQRESLKLDLIQLYGRIADAYKGDPVFDAMAQSKQPSPVKK
jgi:hypothetical protein